MPLRIVEISAPDTEHDKIKEVAEKHNAIDYWYSAKNKDKRRSTQILIHLSDQQALMDDLQSIMYKAENWRLVVLPVESTLPKLEEDKEDKKNGKTGRPTMTREALYNEVKKGAEADSDFILLVLLSTLVCAIGLIGNNVAVVIGAMVIAPLLGPILALAFGAALGDRDLMTRSIKSNATGLGLTLGMAITAGAFMDVPLASQELMGRAYVGYDSLILAFAAGAAAVLSLTTGLSATLVGVMVAVALMPPAVAMGLFIGDMRWDNAYSAALLLTANIVCVSLAAQLVFLLKGIKPRTWYMQKKSKQSMTLNIICWAVMLAALVVLIALRGGV